MNPGMDEEEIILNRMLRGTGENARSALAVLYSKHAQSLFEFLYLMMGKDENKARDIVQDTFLRVFEKRDLYNPSLPFRPWLFRIASNFYKNEFRRMEIQKQNLGEMAREYPDFSTSDSTDLNVEKIWKLVDRLGTQQREVIILRFRTGLPLKEIAEIIQKPEGTIRSRLFYALKTLSETIKTTESEFFNI